MSGLLMEESVCCPTSPTSRMCGAYVGIGRGFVLYLPTRWDICLFYLGIKIFSEMPRVECGAPPGNYVVITDKLCRGGTGALWQELIRKPPHILEVGGEAMYGLLHYNSTMKVGNKSYSDASDMSAVSYRRPEVATVLTRFRWLWA